MENSRTYYGGTFLDYKDLAESRVRNKVELEYYTTRACSKLNEDGETYGIEIVKKEYDKDCIKVESGRHEKICNNLDKITEIIEVLKRCKVTPIGLNDVIDEMYKTRITE